MKNVRNMKNERRKEEGGRRNREKIRVDMSEVDFTYAVLTLSK
jgi:hypothetical protein